MLEFVEQTEIFLPAIVDVVEQDGFFEFANHIARFGFVGFLEIHTHIVDEASVADGH